MHRSRLAAVVIDSRTDDLDKEAAFWGAALGMSVSTPNGSDRYRDVTGPADQPQVLVQQVEHARRVPLATATAAVAAEVKRLEALDRKTAGEGTRGTESLEL